MKHIVIHFCFLIATLMAFDTDLFAQTKPLAPTTNLKEIEELVDRYFVSLNEPDDK